MAVFCIEDDKEYSLLVEKLENSVIQNMSSLKGKEKMIEQNLNKVELALYDFFTNNGLPKPII